MAATQETTESTTAEVVRSYFDALGRHDRNTWRDHFAPNATDHIAGRLGPAGLAETEAYFLELLEAFPDLRLEIQDVLVQDDRAVVRWRLSGTFAGAKPMDGIEPNGARVETQGMDMVWVRDGKIARIEAVLDTMAVARGIGVLPPEGSKAEQGMARAFNVRTKLASRVTGDLEKVADGVWSLMGNPGHCRVYFIEESDGVTMFDAGGRTMTKAVAKAATRLGGLKRIVLGHGHTDHRGTAPGLGVPVYCHPDEVLDAEGSGGFRYWGEGLPKLDFPIRPIHRFLHQYAWDGGPVQIAGTVSEGDAIAGFEVVHLPGHAPGLIGLWRESDRLALVTDAFYTVDLWGRDTPAHIPEPNYNLDTEQARASLRKLAALEPSAAWPGHAKPVTEDARSQIEHAADAT
jgi:hydroxyacylglutathione hydrolase